MVFICNCMLFKSTNKANLYQIQSFTVFKKTGFFMKILLNNCKKQVHKGYPLAGPCICNSKLELALAIINNLSGSSWFFFPSSLVFLIVAEWFLFVIACFSKAKTKQTFTKSKTLPCSVNENPIKAYQKTEVLKQNSIRMPLKPIRKTEVLNQNPMKIPSEPLRKERICRNLTEALGKSWDFRFTTAEQTPPSFKKT